MTFSVIIPHRNSIDTISKLFGSIPDIEDIEIILIDNSPKKITKEQIGVHRDYELLYSEPSKGAGGARNVGLNNAHGKWLVFADADDYFSEGAFDVFSKHIEDKADVVYFSADSIYLETGAKAGRGVPFTRLVRNYLQDPTNDLPIRIKFEVPWAKMVKREFVLENDIKFDEVPACNDTMFSTKVGCKAKSIGADDSYVYVVTDSERSISKTFNKAAVVSRFNVYLEKNKYLKSLGYSDYQNSIAFFVIQMGKKDVVTCLKMIYKLIKYHQNPLIGYNRWFKTLKRVIKHRGHVTEDWK